MTQRLAFFLGLAFLTWGLWRLPPPGGGPESLAGRQLAPLFFFGGAHLILALAHRALPHHARGALAFLSILALFQSLQLLWQHQALPLAAALFFSGLALGLSSWRDHARRKHIPPHKPS